MTNRINELAELLFEALDRKGVACSEAESHLLSHLSEYFEQVSRSGKVNPALLATEEAREIRRQQILTAGRLLVEEMKVLQQLSELEGEQNTPQ